MKSALFTLSFLTLILSACRIPESKKVYYPDTQYLKEMYTAYEENGKEVMDGLYIRFQPSGLKEVEIFYQDGREISRSNYDSEGRLIGTEAVAKIE